VGEGGMPWAGLTNAGGVLFGTGSYGGAFGHGTIFRINLDGTGMQTLHHFDGTSGRGPNSSLLVRGTSLYGTTMEGGSADKGVVFTLRRGGNGFEILHEFADDGGAYPNPGVLRGVDGALYGTTERGGDHDGGVIFRLAVPED
jgi:uncharacterized repeat protein (TIGR03803 family)